MREMCKFEWFDCWWLLEFEIFSSLLFHFFQDILTFGFVLGPQRGAIPQGVV